jgi:hypothetical protein
MPLVRIGFAHGGCIGSTGRKVSRLGATRPREHRLDDEREPLWAGASGPAAAAPLSRASRGDACSAPDRSRTAVNCLPAANVSASPLAPPPAADAVDCGLFKPAGIADAGRPSGAHSALRGARAVSTGKRVRRTGAAAVCGPRQRTRATSPPNAVPGSPRQPGAHDAVGLQRLPPQVELL